MADLTPEPGRALDDCAFDLTPDGALAVTTWTITGEAATLTTELAVISVASGERRVLAADPGQDFHGPRTSPDGQNVACVRSAKDSYDNPGDVTLVVIPLDKGADGGTAEARDVLEGLDRRPLEAAWSADSGWFSSPRTTRGGGRCSGSTWPAAWSPG